MWAILRSGSWATRQRVRAVSWIMLGTGLLLLTLLLATSSGTLDRLGRPLGTDFSNVWTAGRMALEGRAAEAWDWPAHHQVQQATHGRADVPFYGWHYPPPFLLLAALLGTMPYLVALFVWQAATLTAAALLVRKVAGTGDVLLPALAAPVVLICLAHGHNGFLTAVLLGGGLLLLDRRPWVAGLLLGCLIYKPQFGLLLPLLLVTGRHGRAFAGACLSAGTLTAVTLSVWGWPVWQAFLDSLPLTRTVVIEAGGTGWEKIQSAFAAVRGSGGGLPLAYAVQGAVTALSIAAALGVAVTAHPRLRAAAATATAMLSTPYVLDYDFVVLGVGAVFLWADARARGFLDWEKSALALIWITPLIGRQVAEHLLLPLGLLSALLLLTLSVRRAVLLDDAAARVRAWPFRRSRAASAR